MNQSSNDSSDKDDSDISDIDDDWKNDDMVVSEWISDEEEEQPKIVKPKELDPGAKLPASEYIQANADLYLSLLEVKDLHFESMSVEKKEELMKTLVIEKFNPGEVIFKQHELSFDMYVSE